MTDSRDKYRPPKPWQRLIPSKLRARPATGTGSSRLPDFLVIGAAKSASSSLMKYLRQHPDIFIPKTRTGFFAVEQESAYPFGGKRHGFTFIPDLETYHAVLAEAPEGATIGEASALYMYYPKACARIHSHLPDVRLIATLRHPTERAYSAYRYMVRKGREEIQNFESALTAEDSRAADNWLGPMWLYRQAGLYYQQLKPYYDTFGQDQIRIVLFEDLARQGAESMRSIFGFLGVDDSFAGDFSTRHNVTGTVNLPDGDAATKARLTDSYRDEILQLQDLIGRDLSHWLDPGYSG